MIKSTFLLLSVILGTNPFAYGSGLTFVAGEIHDIDLPHTNDTNYVFNQTLDIRGFGEDSETILEAIVKISVKPFVTMRSTLVRECIGELVPRDNTFVCNGTWDVDEVSVTSSFFKIDVEAKCLVGTSNFIVKDSKNLGVDALVEDPRSFSIVLRGKVQQGKTCTKAMLSVKVPEGIFIDGDISLRSFDIL